LRQLALIFRSPPTSAPAAALLGRLRLALARHQGIGYGLPQGRLRGRGRDGRGGGERGVPRPEGVEPPLQVLQFLALAGQLLPLGFQAGPYVRLVGRHERRQPQQDQAYPPPRHGAESCGCHGGRPPRLGSPGARGAKAPDACPPIEPFRDETWR
jgi:hypothetical protein